MVDVGRAVGGNIGRIDQEKGVDIVEKMEKRSKGKRGKGKDETARLKL
jgi:hypothetical protein